MVKKSWQSKLEEILELHQQWRFIDKKIFRGKVEFELLGLGMGWSHFRWLIYTQRYQNKHIRLWLECEVNFHLPLNETLRKASIVAHYRRTVGQSMRYLCLPLIFPWPGHWLKLSKAMFPSMRPHKWVLLFGPFAVPFTSFTRTFPT